MKDMDMDSLTIESSWQEELHKIEMCQNLKDWDVLRVRLLGKNGLLTQELKKLASFPSEERRERGASLNKARESLKILLEKKKNFLEIQELDKKLQEDAVDVSLPCRPQLFGKRHLLTQISDDLVYYFQSQGFQIMDGPEVDSEFYNFEALNMPAHHPARQEQDTLYLKNFPGMLLRTHTSTMQGRTFSTVGVPIRAVSLGSVFRNDAVDATHSPLFHQIEIFVVEPGITMAHMKYCLLDLLSYLFKMDLCASVEQGKSIPVRFRPSFFPFTEPSIEVDCCCSRVQGELKLDIKGKWLEILGCGMIHPNVFKNCGLETFENGTPVQGFAIGIGIERIAMLKYGITDIRQFYENDMRWLNHYGCR